MNSFFDMRLVLDDIKRRDEEEKPADYFHETRGEKRVLQGPEIDFVRDDSAPYRRVHFRGIWGRQSHF